ncbi:GDP-mannose 4,6-dehydratase [Ferruginibacter yonginensis]|uniref:GDP-mannose 4,6-dehydratase n=1 Tax=Ferruginibacter yonginensis TaxID=1310416 RepID=A0ABV8QPN2_9BACT
MRILITGVAGFAARHFLHFLNEQPHHSEVAGIYNETLPSFDITALPNINISLHQIDLLDKEALTTLFNTFNPTHVLHLAGRSSVANSWKAPAVSITDNTNFFLNIVEIVRLNKLNCRILSVGSTEEYGNANAGLPLKETDCPEPASPYGVARVLQQKLVSIYANSYGVDIMHTRSFNHIGAYQKADYVIASFAKQVVQQSKSNTDTISLVTGDVNVMRDFSDVRDVVRAYYLLLQKGEKGETYNVCSGKGFWLKDIITMLAETIGKPIHHTTDPNNFRPSENKVIVGSYDKLYQQTGWQPQYNMEAILKNIIDYWEGVL